MRIDYEYTDAEIEKKLEAGEATIEGKASSGLWPDRPHNWIVTLHKEMRTVHVPVDEHPEWERFAPAEPKD